MAGMVDPKHMDDALKFDNIMKVVDGIRKMAIGGVSITKLAEGLNQVTLTPKNGLERAIALLKK